MTTNESIWKSTPLSAPDSKLVDAYVQIGISLDSLPYTPEFQELAKKAGLNPRDDSELHQAFRRLVNLRKRAMLPTIGLRHAQPPQKTA